LPVGVDDLTGQRPRRRDMHFAEIAAVESDGHEHTRDRQAAAHRASTPGGPIAVVSARRS